MRSSLSLVLAFLVVTLAPSAKGEPDMDGFITWEQWQQAEEARSTKAVHAVDAAVVREQVHEQVSNRTYIRFGAGASYLMPVHLSSDATGSKVWPEFSAWVAPFGRFAEIGADLSLGKDATLLLRPGLKFYAFESDLFALYLEGTAGIYSHQEGTAFGGGCGAGLIIGLMENLTIELHGSVTVFSLSDDVLVDLLGQQAVSTGDPLDGVTLFTSVGARLMTRF